MIFGGRGKDPASALVALLVELLGSAVSVGVAGAALASCTEVAGCSEAVDVVSPVLEAAKVLEGGDVEEGAGLSDGSEV